MQSFFKTLSRYITLLCFISASPLLSRAQDPTPGNPDNNPLPVTLTYFSATNLQKGTATILWQTATEINASHFNVQRSFTGTDFSTIAQINAIGNSNTATNYSYIDNYSTTANNTIYYRLQQLDKNGSISYSNIVRITNTNTSTNKATSYPNPIINNSFTIDLVKPITQPIAYTIVTANGQIIKQGTITQRQQLITCTALPKGNYLLQLADGQSVQLTK